MRSGSSPARSSSTRRCRSRSATSRSPTTTPAITTAASPSCGSACGRPRTTATRAGSWAAPTRSWASTRRRWPSSSSCSGTAPRTWRRSSSSRWLRRTEGGRRSRPSGPRARARAETSRAPERYHAELRSQQVRARESPEPQVVEGNELAHYNLGLAFRQKGYYNEALREYRLALERGEDRRLTLQAMAEVHLL